LREDKDAMGVEEVSQTFLTENPPMILDATCSYKKIWPRHATIRIDIRPEVHPDRVLDARHTDFPDHYFDEIYCDPPHLIAGRKLVIDKIIAACIRSGRTRSSSMFERYGYWITREDWHDFLRETNKEFYRILKPTGILNYKITDGKTERGYKGGATHLHEMDMMTNFKIIKQRITSSGARMTKNPSKVYWLTMKPI